MVHKVEDKEQFDKFLEEAGDKLIVVDFFATWCGPCKAIAPFMQELSEKYPTVLFLKVDVDDNEEVAALYEISCMPTFIFLKNKEKVDEFSGANQSKLEEMVVKHQ